MKYNDQVALGCQTSLVPNIPRGQSSQVPNIPGGQTSQVPNIPRCLISLVPNIPRGQTSWVPNIPGGQMSQMPNILRGLICRCQMCFGAKCQVPSIPMLNVLGAKWVTASCRDPSCAPDYNKYLVSTVKPKSNILHDSLFLKSNTMQ